VVKNIYPPIQNPRIEGRSTWPDWAMADWFAMEGDPSLRAFVARVDILIRLTAQIADLSYSQASEDMNRVVLGRTKRFLHIDVGRWKNVERSFQDLSRSQRRTVRHIAEELADVLSMDVHQLIVMSPRKADPSNYRTGASWFKNKRWARGWTWVETLLSGGIAIAAPYIFWAAAWRRLDLELAQWAELLQWSPLLFPLIFYLGHLFNWREMFSPAVLKFTSAKTAAALLMVFFMKMETVPLERVSLYFGLLIVVLAYLHWESQYRNTPPLPPLSRADRWLEARVDLPLAFLTHVGLNALSEHLRVAAGWGGFPFSAFMPQALDAVWLLKTVNILFVTATVLFFLNHIVRLSRNIQIDPGARIESIRAQKFFMFLFTVFLLVQANVLVYIVFVIPKSVYFRHGVAQLGSLGSAVQGFWAFAFPRVLLRRSLRRAA